MRRNHNKRGVFQRIAAMAMGVAMLGPGPVVNASAPAGNTTQQQSKKDAVVEQPRMVIPISRRSEYMGSGDQNPYKIGRTPKKNQRQKRKYLRQNPHYRK